MAEIRKNRPTDCGWNPWHGCTKISSGCKYCYVYRQDEMYTPGKESSKVTKNADFDLPIRRNKRSGCYKIPSGTLVFTCFTSDFLLAEADEWRVGAWTMMRERSDLMFYFFTKRIERFQEVMPPDWGEGYPNVKIGCTVENQLMADRRLPVFSALPIRHKSIIVAPMLGRVDLTPYLDSSIEEVSVSGESGMEARIICDYDWVLDVRRQCVEREVPFLFHQTGAKLLKDGKLYRIGRRYQIAQARKAAIDYRIS